MSERDKPQWDPCPPQTSRISNNLGSWLCDIIPSGWGDPKQIGKNEGWWFRFENLGGNTKRKGWARECKILLGLLTLLKWEFTESPLAGDNLMKAITWEVLSNAKVPQRSGNRFVRVGRGGRGKVVVEGCNAKFGAPRGGPWFRNCRHPLPEACFYLHQKFTAVCVSPVFPSPLLLTYNNLNLRTNSKKSKDGVWRKIDSSVFVSWGKKGNKWKKATWLTADIKVHREKSNNAIVASRELRASKVGPPGAICSMERLVSHCVRI